MKPNNTIIIIIIASLLMSGCNNFNAGKPMSANKNPGIYFEIPVTDMPRAKAFYEAVFGYDFVSENIHGEAPSYEKPTFYC